MKNALIRLHIAVFLWGFTGVLGRLISLNEVMLVWYRLLITIVSMFIVMKGWQSFTSVTLKHKWALFGIGAIIALHWCFFYGSIKYSNVSIALTCLSSAGLFTSLLEPMFTRKQIIPAEILLGIIGIVGVYLIFHFNPQYKTGILLGLICTVMSCIFSILNKNQVSYTAPKTVMLLELMGGFLFLTIILPLYLYLLPATTLVPTKQDLIWLLILSWVCTILAMFLSLQALQKLSAFTQNLTLNLEPVYGIILAFIVYKENKYLSDSFYFGFTLILLAVVLQTVRVIRHDKKQAVI